MPAITSFRNASIFVKTILIFVIVIVPLFTLSLILNELARKEVQSHVSQSMQERIQYEFRFLEQELRRIVGAQQRLVNDNDLLDLSGQSEIMSDYQRARAVNQLREKLLALRDTSGYIHKASVYIRAGDRIVTTSLTHDKDAMREELEQVALASLEQGVPIVQWKSGLYLVSTSPLRQSEAEFREKPPQFIQSIELSNSTIKEMLARLSEEGEAQLYSAAWQVASGPQADWHAEIRGEWNVREGEAFAEARDSSVYGPQSFTTSGGKRLLVFHAQSPWLEAALAAFVPEDVLFGKLKAYRYWFWLLVVCSVAIIVLFSYGIYLLVQRPLSTLIRMFRNVEQGQLSVIAKPVRKDEFGVIFTHFGQMVSKLKQSIDELYVQKIRLQQSELKQLQAQIMPHFLYNSFFILHHLIKSYENETAEHMSRNLGEYFEYITRNGKQEVPLGQEISHIRSYAEIQNVRFSDRIHASIDELPEKFHAVQVPRLILQPIVENCYEHGFGKTLSGGRLRVSYLDMSDRLCIRFADSGSGMKPAELERLRGELNSRQAEESTGLLNVHRRLQMKFGAGSGLDIKTSEWGGLLVEVYIPLENGAENVESIADRG